MIKAKDIIKTEGRGYNSGKFETEIRAKLYNDNKVYYSNSIIGKIDLLQFKIPEHIYSSEEIVGRETCEKAMFLDADGMKEYAEKVRIYNKEREKKEVKNKKPRK